MTDPETPQTHSPDLTNVHQALQEASLASKEGKAMKNFSVRLPEALRTSAQEICERHGTELGTYLRKCCEGLVKDYGVTPSED